MPPPARTSRNMAYYDPACADEINTIQELRAKRFLPLSAIRVLLQARRQGQGSTHIDEMRTMLEGIYRPLSEKSPAAPLPRDEFLQTTGLKASTLREFEESGVIAPQPGKNGPLYDDIELNLGNICAKLVAFGLKADDLRFYRQYIEFLRIEARALHEMLHRRPDHEGISLIDFFQTIRDFREQLMLRDSRREAGHSKPKTDEEV